MIEQVVQQNQDNYVIKMQQRQYDEGNNDSDNDEGFIVNTAEIKHKQVSKIVVGSTARPTDYQPRYINSHSLIRKQLPDIFTSYPHFPNEDMISSRKMSRKKDRDAFAKIQQNKFPNRHYQLVYQRYNKKMQNESINTQNRIDLASVITYSAQNYSILKNWDIRSNPEDLVFQSRFECGNLMYAYKSLANPYHYILYLQNDTNTNGYNKWFYFAVKNTKKMVNYTFSIVNYRKNLVFIKQGMKPTRFSLKQQEAKGNGWSRCTSKVGIYRSKIGQDSQFSQHYTVTFQATFQYENDTNFFSLIPPYSYSKLISFLQSSSITVSDKSNINFDYKTIAFTLSNTQVPYVKISNRLNASKKNIIILARQHPGQVWSSFAVQALMNELLRDSFPQKDWLLHHYTFRIFPMVNIDGVIYGNFRCDLSGTDLNRSWKDPNKLLHPHLVAIKQEIRRLSVQEEVVSCFDFHGHSKDFNIFAYCCKTDNQGKMLPLLISRMSPVFQFPACTFGISKYKQSTARAVIYDIAKVSDVLTVQCSFYASVNPLKVFTPSSFITFAGAIIKALKHYYSKDKESQQAEDNLPAILAQIAARPKLRQKYSLNQQSGSDSQPQIDEIAINEKIGKILPKCAVVEQIFGLNKQQQKNKFQELKKKKQQSLLRQKNNIRKNDTKLVQVIRNTISQQPILNKVQKPPLIASRSKANSNTTNTFIDRLYKKKERKTVEVKQRNVEKTTKYVRRQQKNQSLQLHRQGETLNRYLAQQFRSTYREKKTQISNGGNSGQEGRIVSSSLCAF